MVMMTSLTIFMKMKYSPVVRFPRHLFVFHFFFFRTLFHSFRFLCFAFYGLEVESIHFDFPKFSKTTTQIVSCYNILYHQEKPTRMK